MGTRRHLSESAAPAFFRNTLSREDYRWAVRHLLRQCERCSALMRRVATAEGIFKEPRAEEREYAFEDILFYPEAESFGLAVGRVIGLAQLAFLESMPSAVRFDRVRHHKEFQHIGLYDRLIEQAIDESRGHPERVSEIASLAITLAAEIKTAPAGRGRCPEGRWLVPGAPAKALPRARK